MTARPASGRAAILAFLLLSLLPAPACDRGGSGQTTITGKTVYRGMAIEDVPVVLLLQDGDRWRETASGRSGYHGAFALPSPPGTIRLEAKGEIVMGSRRIALAGAVDGIDVPPGTRRIDRIVIELAPVPKGTDGSQ